MAQTLEFWFRRKYNLTRSDPRFLAATLDEMYEDYWAHRITEDPKALDEVTDDDFDIDEVTAAMERDDWIEVTSGRYQVPG